MSLFLNNAYRYISMIDGAIVNGERNIIWTSSYNSKLTDRNSSRGFRIVQRSKALRPDFVFPKKANRVLETPSAQQSKYFLKIKMGFRASSIIFPKISRLVLKLPTAVYTKVYKFAEGQSYKFYLKSRRSSSRLRWAYRPLWSAGLQCQKYYRGWCWSHWPGFPFLSSCQKL